MINVNRAEHVRSWSDLEFLPGALDGLALLTRSGIQVVVVTNQAIVNRGVVTRAALDRIHERMIAEIDRQDGAVQAFWSVPIGPMKVVPAGSRPRDSSSTRCPSWDRPVRRGDDRGPSARPGGGAPCRLPVDPAAQRTGSRTAPGYEPPVGCLAIVPGLLEAARFLTGSSANVICSRPWLARIEGARPRGR